MTLTNVGTAAVRTEVTDADGNYAFRNIDVGVYSVSIKAQGFQSQTMSSISLTARETRRADATMRVSGDVQTVVVDDKSAVPVITTDVSNLAETKVGDELVKLPVAIYSRSTGSTSPISTLTTEAGVQTDDSGNLAVLGTTAALLSVTVDGISSVGVEYSGPVNEMFPSFNSIEEIRVERVEQQCRVFRRGRHHNRLKGRNHALSRRRLREQREHGLQLQQHFRAVEAEDHHE